MLSMCKIEWVIAKEGSSEQGEKQPVRPENCQELLVHCEIPPPWPRVCVSSPSPLLFPCTYAPLRVDDFP
jgi:hypothetical protein